MKFRKTENKEKEKHIAKQDETNNTETKVYDMISQRRKIKAFNKLNRNFNGKAEAVIIIAIDENGEKLLLNNEYRPDKSGRAFDFPIGIMNKGETPIECAKRELLEEKGLEIYEYEEVLDTSYSAMVFGDEKDICVLCKAKYSFFENSPYFDESEIKWYTKAEVKELLKTEDFAARAQVFCHLWCN